MRTHAIKFSKKNLGITLLETLFAISIGMLISLLLTKIYFELQKTTLHHAVMQQHAETAQRMEMILRNEINAAGSIGCARLKDKFVVESSVDDNMTAENYLQVTDKTVTVRYQSFPGVVLLRDMQDKVNMLAEPDIRIQPGQHLLISDCRHAEIFQVANVIKMKRMQVISSVKPLHRNYKKQAEIGFQMHHQYFMDKSGYQQKNHPVTFALMRRDGNGSRLELVKDVSDMKFSRDANGVFYEFATNFAAQQKVWRGYIRCFACEG